MALGGPELDDALSLARAIVAEATVLLRGAAGRVGPVATKANPRDLVTEWDTRAEDLIRGRLTERSPGIPILGEEGGTSGGGASGAAAAGAPPALRWLIDPIDGTVNFSHGLPLWGVCLALEEAGRPVVGVVAAPALGWEHHARRGGGAFAEGGARLAVSQTAPLERAILATGFPYDRATTRWNFDAWEHFQVRAGACRRLGAASIDLALVARGWLDGYWEDRLHPWDLSAGALLVEEAGGRVTSITGGPFVSATGEAVATNGAIHEEVLTELAAVRAARRARRADAPE
jgi:myo-inositol-1(or 4)-monophosphatase